jgi:hypothetical protein
VIIGAFRSLALPACTIWLMLGTASPVLAAGPCDHITNAFAYNECLAKQGPQRGAREPRSRGGDPEATVRTRRDASRDTTAADTGVRITRGRGRTRVVIDPWGQITRSAPPQTRKRRR